jgi:hypothetical protein
MVSTNVDTLVDAAYLGHSNLVTAGTAMEFLTYPGTNSTFPVYDGTIVQCQSNATVVTLDLASTARSVLFRIIGGMPAGVERDGVRLTRYTNAAAFAAATLGWYYSASDTRTLVKFQHAGGSATVTLGPDTVGDGIPNSWRDYYFGTPGSTNASTCATCDADGDGMSNQAEYYTGTDPSSATNHLRGRTGTPPVFSVAWDGQPGIEYKVGWLNDITNGATWQLISSVYTGVGSALTWIDDGTDTGIPPANSPTGRRFYRVTVP